MVLESFTAENFRCLANIEFEADPHYNLVVGPNASGKTSILEAVAYLGRGKSFRGAPTANLIRHGEKSFLLFGRVIDGKHRGSVGVRNSAGGLEVRVDGVTGGGAAALAAALPLQVIDPDVHNLVAGAPDERRRYLDWIAFHVEHGYLESWRRFRRALKQRNAALRLEAKRAVIDGWSAEFCEHARAIDTGRRAALRKSTRKGAIATMRSPPPFISPVPAISRDRSPARCGSAPCRRAGARGPRSPGSWGTSR